MHEKLQRELRQAIANEQFEEASGGILFPRQGVLACGEYFDRVNGGDFVKAGDNLVTTEGFAHLLNVALGGKAKASGYYLALFSGSATPANSWTAASFAAAANEITSQTEGYTSATRPQWTPAETATNQIDNFAAAASFTMATASTLTVTGAALLSNATRGGTTGVLISASKYAAERVFQAGDTYDVGWRLTLTT